MAPVAGRKPLLIVLNVVATTVVLLGAVLPAVDGNYSTTSPYLYIAAETSFLAGWLFGITYCVVMAMSIREYSLAHLGLTPALVGLMFMFAGLAGAGLIMDWMQRCNTGEIGGGPWDGCTETMDAGGMGGGGSGTSSGGGTSACPCPSSSGNRCNCKRRCSLSPRKVLCCQAERVFVEWQVLSTRLARRPRVTNLVAATSLGGAPCAVEGPTVEQFINRSCSLNV